MNVTIIGGAGFIGTNLAISLSVYKNYCITLIDRKAEFFETIKALNLNGVNYRISDYSLNTDFDNLLKGQDVVYHLASTNIPGTSNMHIPEEIKTNFLIF